MSQTFDFTIKNDLKEISGLTIAANEFLEPKSLDPKIVYSVNLVLEEMLVNTITHGYDDSGDHKIAVRIALAEDEICIIMEDDGTAFNPLSIPWASHSAQAGELIEDGLGIHFVRNMMDAMQYRRENDKNILEVCIDI